MFRLHWPCGAVSDMTNLSRAVDAAVTICERGPPARNRRLFGWQMEAVENALLGPAHSSERGRPMTTTAAANIAPVLSSDKFYSASPIKRRRRTKAEITSIKQAIFDILSADHPQTVRQVFYALTVRGLIVKAQMEYKRTVGRLLVDMREAGEESRSIGSPTTLRWMRKPSTFPGWELNACLR